MPALHVCVKTCVFNSNKRDVLRTSWAVSHGACLAGLITGISYYLEPDCCTRTVLGKLGMVIPSH